MSFFDLDWPKTSSCRKPFLSTAFLLHFINDKYVWKMANNVLSINRTWQGLVLVWYRLDFTKTTDTLHLTYSLLRSVLACGQFSPSTISHQWLYIVTSFYQHNYMQKMMSQCTGEKWSSARIGRTPVGYACTLFRRDYHLSNKSICYELIHYKKD